MQKVGLMRLLFIVMIVIRVFQGCVGDFISEIAVWKAGDKLLVPFVAGTLLRIAWTKVEQSHSMCYMDLQT